MSIFEETIRNETSFSILIYHFSLRDSSPFRPEFKITFYVFGKKNMKRKFMEVHVFDYLWKKFLFELKITNQISKNYSDYCLFEILFFITHSYLFINK
jgi:hypothetical protein